MDELGGETCFYDIQDNFSAEFKVKDVKCRDRYVFNLRLNLGFVKDLRICETFRTGVLEMRI